MKLNAIELKNIFFFKLKTLYNFIVIDHPMRNSTQKFRQKYQSPSKRTMLGPANLEKAYRRALYCGLPTAKQQNQTTKTLSSRRLQKTRDMLSRNINIKTKQTIQTEANQKTQTPRSHVHYAFGQLMRSHGDVSETSTTLQDLRWDEQDSDCIIASNPKQFIEKMPKNTIFFCCKCFNYIFQIEKKRHFPQCKDRLNQQQIKNTQIGWQRLQTIVQLAKYTNMRSFQIQELFRQVTSHQFNSIYWINYPIHSQFFVLEQIRQAFAYTYQNLLQGAIYRKKNKFFCA